MVLSFLSEEMKQVRDVTDRFFLFLLCSWGNLSSRTFKLETIYITCLIVFSSTLWEFDQNNLSTNWNRLLMIYKFIKIQWYFWWIYIVIRKGTGKLRLIPWSSVYGEFRNRIRMMGTSFEFGGEHREHQHFGFVQSQNQMFSIKLSYWCTTDVLRSKTINSHGFGVLVFAVGSIDGFRKMLTFNVDIRIPKMWQ